MTHVPARQCPGAAFRARPDLQPQVPAALAPPPPYPALSRPKMTRRAPALLLMMAKTASVTRSATARIETRAGRGVGVGTGIVTGRGTGTGIRDGVAVGRGVAIVEIVDVGSGGLQKKFIGRMHPTQRASLMPPPT